MEKPSTVETRSAHEKLRQIEMVGQTSHQISGAKLPSNRQVLQVFFYNMRFVQQDANASAKLALKAVLIFWEQARIPVRDVYRCSDQILKLYKQWTTIKKRIPSKRSPAQIESAKKFQDSLDDLFDISPEDVFSRIRIEEDKQFLIKQKQKGRPGCMAGVDMKLFAREFRSFQRQKNEQSRKRKYEQMSGQNGTLQYLL